MVSTPDPGDFVSRANTGLTAQGDGLRFTGTNLSWLALRSDTGLAKDARYPTDFEIDDALATVQAIGASVIRVTSLGASAGCNLCLMPAWGKFQETAFARMDTILAKARDLGLKVIIPLAGRDTNCATASAAQPLDGGICAFVHWRGKPEAGAFFADPSIRDDFREYVLLILHHVNTLNHLAYRDDPTILAWENCDGCGQGQKESDVADWTEALGRIIKAEDPHHLYENGAFAGHIGAKAASPVSPAALALPSVDIIGDRIAPSEAPATADTVADAQAAVTKAGRAYVIDAYGWSPADWKTTDDLQGFLDAMRRDRDASGVLLIDLQSHADQGGYLPVPRSLAPDRHSPPLYFPGSKTVGLDPQEMVERARLIRRFNYTFTDLKSIPFYLSPPAPEILSVVGGKLSWRGSAGAVTYSIERTNDPGVPNSWREVCHRCVSDSQDPWQDPQTPTGPAWYRITPFNVNNHAGDFSDPVQSTAQGK